MIFGAMGNEKGTYRYAPHRRLWGIWMYQSIGKTSMGGTFIKDCETKEEARREVYRLNGWNYKEKK